LCRAKVEGGTKALVSPPSKNVVPPPPGFAPMEAYKILVEYFVQNENILMQNVSGCNLCLNEASFIMLQCVGILCNIILNNYSKAKSDNVKYTAVINKQVTKF